MFYTSIFKSFFLPQPTLKNAFYNVTKYTCMQTFYTYVIYIIKIKVLQNLPRIYAKYSDIIYSVSFKKLISTHPMISLDCFSAISWFWTKGWFFWLLSKLNFWSSRIQFWKMRIWWFLEIYPNFVINVNVSCIGRMVWVLVSSFSLISGRVIG